MATQQIFVSYAHDDKSRASRLVTKLEALTGEKVNYWLDEQYIEPGQILSAGIANAINDSTGMIIILPSRQDGPWVRAELAIAYAKAQNDPKFKIIPVIFGPTDIPSLLAGRVYVNLSEASDFDRGAESIAKSILEPTSTEITDRNAAITGVLAQKLALERDVLEWRIARKDVAAPILWLAAVSLFPILAALTFFSRGSSGFAQVIIQGSLFIFGVVFGYLTADAESPIRVFFWRNRRAKGGQQDG